MCRWAAYIGKPIFMEEVVSRPKHSLIHQSHCATECKTAINADGFGLAWYGDQAEPGQYRDVSPAWSDANLKSLVRQVKSGLFLSHVRASTGTATSRNNCHPFTSKQWSFMHNGQVGGFEHFRRCGDMLIPDDYYCERRGATDSEALFLVALSEGMNEDPCGALERATAKFEALSRARGSTPHIRMTAAFSDGKKLYAVRYATDDKAPTLYHRWSETHQGRAVVSEPLETDEDDWVLVPPGTFCTFDGEGVEMQPFAPLSVSQAA
jgi:glutamine amidotransferase